jgi:hypothetical protein
MEGDICLITPPPTGHATAPAVSQQLLTMKARIHSHCGPCGTFGGKSCTLIGFSPSPLFISYHCSSVFTYISSGGMNNGPISSHSPTGKVSPHHNNTIPPPSPSLPSMRFLVVFPVHPSKCLYWAVTTVFKSITH